MLFILYYLFRKIIVNGFKSEIGTTPVENPVKNPKQNPEKNPNENPDKNSDKKPTKNPEKTGGTTLYVGGIPRETSKEFIKSFLRDKIPNAADIRVPMDKVQGTSKGIAFVQLPSGVNVKDVLKQVKGLEMGVRRLKINESKPRESGDGATLFVSGLPYDTTEEGIKEFLRDKIPNARNVRVPINRDGRIKYMAFVRLIPGVNVQDVLRQVEGLEMNGRRLRINETQPREGERPGAGQSGGGFGGGNSFGGGFSSAFKSYSGGFGGNASNDMNIDRQQSLFSSYQNDKNQPAQPSAGKPSGQTTTYTTTYNLRTRYRGVPLKYRPLDSSDEEEAELIALMKACA